jgi:hypothetical protein
VKHLPFLDEQASKTVLQAMGYRDGTRICRNCRFFVPCDQGGSLDALGAHCTRNAFGLEVKPEGTCDHFCDRQSEPAR